VPEYIVQPGHGIFPFGTDLSYHPGDVMNITEEEAAKINTGKGDNPALVPRYGQGTPGKETA